jgi:O-antigen/teichoic acid export membrane protein
LSTAAPEAQEEKRSGYGAGAKILSIGIASTGVVTFAYFSVASYALNDVDYKAISLLWSVLFVIVSVIYRPIEQLLSRTIADRRARGLHTGHPLRTPLLIQAGFALAFLITALALKGPIEDDLFDGSAALYWVLIVAVLAYAASYFARGWLAGHQWFGFYGGLVFMEATSRLLFAVAVAIGIATGQTAVAMGMAAAPFVSLVVVPWAFARRPKVTAAEPETDEEVLDLARGGRFAVAVLCIMLAEQTLLNGGVLAADINATDAAVAGYVFNALLIARAPLQLFQAVQTSLLPHLAGLEATEGRAAFHRAIRQTVLAIWAFAGVVALALLTIGPFVMEKVLDKSGYGRVGLAVLAVGMGLHLTAGTLNQAALARDRAHQAAGAWLAAAALFVVWMIVPIVDDELVRAEVGYAGAAGLLCLMLYGLYRASAPAAASPVSRMAS